MISAFLVAIAALLVAPAFATTITTDSAVARDKTFDYVIAGGGLTGLVVGNKLASAGNSVLIIESGKNLPNVDAINFAKRRGELPAGVCDFNWPLDGMGRAMNTQLGNCVGGSTQINGMVYIRPAKEEIAMLGLISGSDDWSWAGLEPYMDAAERFNKPSAAQVSAGATYEQSAHGTNGAVNVSFSEPYRMPKTIPLYKQAFNKVFSTPAFTNTKDLSARISSPIALANTVWTVWNDKQTGEVMRSSASSAYLYGTNIPKLTVLAEHVVDQVIMDKKMKATGLRFGSASNKVMYNVSAKKQVLLAGGCLGTPLILQRSGIGAKEDLKAAGIAQQLDLPVGKNLGEHAGTTVSASMKYEAYASGQYVDAEPAPFAPLIALPNLKQVFGNKWTTTVAKLALDLYPQAQAALKAGAFSTLESALFVYAALLKQISLDDTPIAECIGEAYPYTFSLISWPLQPFSRGFVRARSADPFAAPYIVPRFFSHPFDTDVGVAVSKKLRDMFSTPSLAPLVDNPNASPASNDFTDGDWADFYESTSYGAGHWSGATSMLPREVGGVVDTRLRVYGTSSLRVIDMGILPLQLTTHTQALAYGIALKAAEMILADS